MKIALAVEFLEFDGWHPVGIGDTEDPEIALQMLLDPPVPQLKRGWIVSAREEHIKGSILGFAIVRNGERRCMELATLDSRVGKTMRREYSLWIGRSDHQLDFKENFVYQNSINGMIVWIDRIGVVADGYAIKIIERIFDEIFIPEIVSKYGVELFPDIGIDLGNEHLFSYFARLMRKHRNNVKGLETTMSEITRVSHEVDFCTQKLLQSLRSIAFSFWLDATGDHPTMHMIYPIMNEMDHLIDESNFMLGAELRKRRGEYIEHLYTKTRQIIYEEMSEQPFLLAMHAKMIRDREG